MTPEQTIEVLERIENRSDGLHKNLVATRERMIADGFDSSRIDAEVAAIVELLKRLDLKADELRAQVVQEMAR